MFQVLCSRCRARRGVWGAESLTFSIVQALGPVVVPAGAFCELEIWLFWLFNPLFTLIHLYLSLFAFICLYLPLITPPGALLSRVPPTKLQFLGSWGKTAGGAEPTQTISHAWWPQRGRRIFCFGRESGLSCWFDSHQTKKKRWTARLNECIYTVLCVEFISRGEFVPKPDVVDISFWGWGSRLPFCLKSKM